MKECGSDTCSLPVLFLSFLLHFFILFIFSFFHFFIFISKHLVVCVKRRIFVISYVLTPPK